MRKILIYPQCMIHLYPCKHTYDFRVIDQREKIK